MLVCEKWKIKYGKNIGSRVITRGLSLLLSVLMIISVFPVTSFAATTEYPTPAKITTIDAGNSSADNTAWYYGTQTVNAQTTVIQRYAQYTSGQSDEVAYLSTVLGTQACPFIIETGLELAEMSGIVNNGIDTFEGKYIRLAGSKKAGSTLTDNVIDLVGACGVFYQSSANGVSWLPCDSNNNSFGWTPIGTEVNKFNGNIYADENVTLYNLAANLTTGNNHTVFGLFGYLGGSANVNNINLKDVQIMSSAAVNGRTIGTLAGICETGASVTNCNVTSITPGRRETLADGTAVSSSKLGDGNYNYNWYTVPDFMIETTESNVTCIGGLIGAMCANSATKNTTVSGININGGFMMTAGMNIGGVIGAAQNLGKGTLTVSDISGSVTFSTMTTSGYMYHVGGVVGYCTSDITANTPEVNVVINGVATAGNPLKVTLNGYGYSDSGDNNRYGGFAGIVGYCNTMNSLTIGSAEKPCYVSFNCSISKLPSRSETNNFYIGGVIGRVRTESNVSSFNLNISYCNVVDSYIRRYANSTDTLRIAMGGIVGAVNYALPNSSISHCTVDNFSFSTDGFCGGIAGLGYSSSGCNIASITYCDFKNSEIFQASASDSKGSYTIVGGIVATYDSNTSQISNCNVINSSINFLQTANERSHNQIGGIVGRVVGASGTQKANINNCTVYISFRIGASNNQAQSGNTTNPTGVFLGGLAGYASNTSVNNCVGVVKYETTHTITNNIEVNPVVLSLSNVAQNTVCGGLIGIANGGVSITGSYTTGDINMQYPDDIQLGNRENFLGGLVGLSSGTGFTVNNSFSTMSLSAELKDALGGLIGYNNCADAVVSSCYFGGSVLNSYGASIVKYSAGGSFTDITYNKKMSPNAPSCAEDITATDSSSVPTAIQSAVSSVSSDYYALATGVSVTFSGNHVFAVNDNLSGTDLTEVRTNTVTVNGVTVERRIKLIENNIDSNEDGLTTAFSIDSSTDVENMQKYVAVGGGYLGSYFEVNTDFTSSISVPIGMANGTVERAEDKNQPFLGLFDGKNHTITLTSDKPSQNYNGFFGYVESADIENINLIYSNNTTITTDNYAGGLVGYAAFSEINNVSVTANNGLNLGGTVSGGVVGYAKSTVINTETTDKSYFNGKLLSSGYLGGIVGKTSNTKPTFCATNGGSTSFTPLTNEITIVYTTMHDSSVSNSYVAGDIIGGAEQSGVSADNQSLAVGGIIGSAVGGNTQVSTSFMYGNVSGGKYVGGIIGNLENTGVKVIVKDSYFNGNVYAVNFAGGIIGYIENEIESATLVDSVYFVGQVDCLGSMGALTSSKASYRSFSYDAQVAGNIPVCANVQDDEAVEITSKALINNMPTSGSGSSVTVYNNTVIANQLGTGANVDISKLYSVTENELTSTVKFYGSPWAYTSGTASSITSTGNNVRLAVKNSGATNQEQSNKVEITFTGSYFNLYDYISGGHDGYTVYIDDNPIIYNSSASSTAYNSTLTQVTQPFTSNSENATVTYIHNPKKSANCLIYVSSDAGLTADTIVNSLSITGLSYTSHKITIVGFMTKSNSYMNIRGYTYGTTGDESIPGGLNDNFTFTETNYPQLTGLMTDFSVVSNLSTDYIYNFTDNITSNAHNFSDADTMTVNLPSYTCDKSSSELSALGVTKNDNVFTVTNPGLSGPFTISSTQAVNGYPLTINEKTIVVPFALGNGTSESPYEIRNVRELVSFRDYINNVYNGAGQYFSLTMTTATPAHSADGTVYDLSGADQNSDSSKLTVSEWNEPIGTETNNFQGVFDGNSKSITNLNITQLTAEANETSCYGGLFGYASSGSVKNLSLEGTAQFNVNNSNNSTTNRQSYYGSLIAVADNSVVTNCYVKMDIDVTYKTTVNNYNVFVGGAVGYVTNNSTVYGVLSDNNISVDSTGAVTSDKWAIGNIVGAGNITYKNAALNISNNISRNNTAFNFSDTAKTARLAQGGIVGMLCSNNTNGRVDLGNNAVYGAIQNYRGNTGGVVGSALVGSGYSLALTGNLCGASLSTGDVTNTDTINRIGGLVGNLNSQNSYSTFTDNTVYGEINCIDNSGSNRTFNVGGLVGYTNNVIATTSLNNYYDSTVNRDITACGVTDKANLFTSNVSSNGARQAYQLVDANGRYAQPVIAEAQNFGSSATLETANKIISGNSAPLFVVRTDNVYTAGEAQQYIALSSVFTLSSSGESLYSDDPISSAVRLTTGNKRAVSTADDNANPVTIRLVSLDAQNNDVFQGYGRQITYYPSVKSTGNTDASYLSANNSGDSLSGTAGDNSYIIYTADELFGIDTALTVTGYDGYGNPCNNPLPRNYKFRLGADIDASGVDYLPDDTSARTIVIGDSTNKFTGIFDGQQHTVSGVCTNSDETDVGLFGVLSSAQIINLGITDSSFTRSGSGNVGSFSGSAEDTEFTGCFSSARVEQSDVSPDGVLVGGLTGLTDSTDYTNCFFTGSVGVTASGKEAYPTISGSGDYYAGGFAGKATGSGTITDCYVSSYVHGDVTPDVVSTSKKHNTGLFVAKGGSCVTLGGCAADFSAGSENCYPLGDRTGVTVSTVNITDGYYPSQWDLQNRTSRETASRIAVTYSTSAASLSRAETVNGTFSNENYGSVYVVSGAADSALYSITDSDKAVNRTNSGIASVLVRFTGADGITSQKMIEINLQCWYDNYTVNDGVKVFTLKSASDLVEFAQIVNDGNDAGVGHSHSSSASNSDIALSHFENAVVKLGNNIVVNDEALSVIGKTAVSAFAGTFDGNSYSIINADFESTNGICGLFGFLADTAVVRNVVFNGTSTVVVSASETGNVYSALAVAVAGNGLVENCYNYSDVAITNNSSANVIFGTVVGKLDSGRTIHYCYNMGHISVHSDKMKIGGIVGENSGEINHCYNTGIIDGYYDPSNSEYEQRTTIGGIAGVNSGNVSECYNAGVIRYAGKNMLYPIAPGTVSACYVDGQYLTTSYVFNDNSTYSDGITVLSTSTMSNGTAFDNSWSGWTYQNGYYPQFNLVTSDISDAGLKNKAASLASSYAGVLFAPTGDIPTFDNFTSLSFRQDSSAVSVVLSADNLGKFSNSVSGGSIIYTVTKRGVATFNLNTTSGDDEYSREVYYINEALFTVNYMFDFSLLIADSNETTLKSNDEYAASGVNTFADPQTRNTYGLGSAGSPYLINTADDLAAFSQYINSSSTGGRERYFMLIRDIDCSTLASWTPIGTSARAFEGTFNGNGHTISGITSSYIDYNGLFGYTGANSTIELTALENCTFYAKTGKGVTSYTGSLAAYCGGVITNCYSRAIVNIPDSTDGVIYAGGLVGELASGSIIRGCYVRPETQNGTNVDAGHNTIVSYTSSAGFVGGILVGKTAGIIDGCYHTAVYYEPVGYSISDYGIIAGEFSGGSIDNTYYDSTVISSQVKPLFTKYGDESLPLLAGASNDYGKTTVALKQTEAPATTDGIANDSMALLLSQNIYLGTYEMSAMPYWDTAAVYTPYSNDGYPMLTAFDISQYSFVSFNSSNIILCIQNIDASNAKLMNALCEYGSYSFPVYADITAKTKLNIRGLSLPDNITYNVSAVGYGYNEVDSSQIKWAVLNGDYTQSRQLYENLTDGEGNVISTGSGSAIVSNLDNNGPSTIFMGVANCIPDNCDKMYVYLSLKSTQTTSNRWGVYHTWDSSTLQELPADEIESD